jgi:TetR/AcrR family transcriptional regulator, transcriptional repressor for nem operon
VARTKEFDPDAVLASALELFWTRGYEATSMADLVEHLGIGKASIYATFGSKHDLYLRALDRYVETKGPTELSALSQPGPVLPAVRALVQRYAEEAARDDSRRGCFVVNAATERLPDDAGTARLVEASWDGLETALNSALIRAQAQGELSPDRDPRAVARFVLVVLQGLRVLGKGQGGPGRLQDGAREALNLLQ